jgi:hypothetical protein
MRHPKRILVCLLWINIAVAAGAQPAAETAGTPEIEPEALGVLKGLADHLTSVAEFGYQVESNYDAVQDFGVKVEFGASRKILISRPDRLRMESSRRDGMEGTVVFDGTDIWVYAPEENVYATTRQPGDLDESLKFAVAQLRMKAPLPGLVSPDFYEIATTGLTRAFHLGVSLVAGVDCDHLLLSNDYADFQMWITTGENPLLRRIVITYREEEGQPQYRAQFLRWNMSPDNVPDLLRFEPPDDAERIRFHIDAPQAGSDQEKRS